MFKEIIWLFVIVGIAASQQEENANEKTQEENPIDVPLNEETDAATDALANYLGFSCPLGHRCLPVLDCLPCEYGTYKDSDGSALCKKCPPDCTTLRKGAQSREECVPFCPPGYERSQCGQTCTRCRPGTYKSSWNGTALCIECPENSNPSEDILGLADVKQCYTGGEGPFPGTTDSDETSSLSTSGGITSYSGTNTYTQSAPQTTATGSTEEWSTFSDTLSTETATPDETSTFPDTDQTSTLSAPVTSDESSTLSAPMTSDESSTLSAPIMSDESSTQSEPGPMTQTSDEMSTFSVPSSTGTTSFESSPSSTPVLSTQSDECPRPCPLPLQTESKLCSHPVNQLFGCLDRCRPGADAVTELFEARSSLHSAVKNKLTHILNEESEWKVIFARFHSECPDLTTTTTTTTAATTVSEPDDSTTETLETKTMTLTTTPEDSGGTDTTETPETTTSSSTTTPSTTTGSQSTQNTGSTGTPGMTDTTEYEDSTTTDTIPISVSTDGMTSADTTGVTDTTEERTTAAGTTSFSPQSTPKSSSKTTSNDMTAVTTTPPAQLSTVTCAQDTECGVGGKCYGGLCGCITTNCSGVAYAAMSGCQYFCQCNDATKKWEIQMCSSGTLFDEMYPGTCNHAYLVGNNICYHDMACETDYCVMPASSEDMCDLFVRNYTRCLRSLSANCDRRPVDVHTAQASSQMENDVIYNELMERLLEFHDNVEQFYINYMKECFEKAALAGA